MSEEVQVLRERIAEVARLHLRRTQAGNIRGDYVEWDVCEACLEPWPCPTREAIEGKGHWRKACLEAIARLDMMEERDRWRERAMSAEAALRSEGYDWPLPEPDAELTDVGRVYTNPIYTEPASEVLDAVVADDRNWIDTDE